MTNSSIDKITIGLAAMLFPPAILTAELITKGMATPLIGLGAVVVGLGLYLVGTSLTELKASSGGG